VEIVALHAVETASSSPSFSRNFPIIALIYPVEFTLIHMVFWYFGWWADLGLIE
jgi:hypothetical protein